MNREIQDLLRRLEADGWAWAQRKVARWAAENVRLAEELAQTRATSEAASSPTLKSLADFAENALALTPGAEQARAVFRLARDCTGEGRAPHPRAASLASRLAAAQPEGALGALFGQGGSGPEAEFLSMLLHEMVLRGTYSGKVAAVADFAHRLAKRSHPLSRLPLYLLDIEASPDLPSYHLRGEACPGLSSGWRRGNTSKLPRPTAGGRTLSPVQVDEASVQSAFAGWMEASNGCLEVAGFAVSPGVGPQEFDEPLLLALPMESLRGARGITLEPVGPDYVWRELFISASRGGAYGGARQGAYGRLRAWQALAGLCGYEGPFAVEAVAEWAKRCTWFKFTADTKWFYNVAWDVGLVCLYPGGSTFVVAAATDTD